MVIIVSNSYYSRVDNIVVGIVAVIATEVMVNIVA